MHCLANRHRMRGRCSVQLLLGWQLLAKRPLEHDPLTVSTFSCELAYTLHYLFRREPPNVGPTMPRVSRNLKMCVCIDKPWDDCTPFDVNAERPRCCSTENLIIRADQEDPAIADRYPGSPGVSGIHCDDVAPI